jgi:hypothetical protein
MRKLSEKLHFRIRKSSAKFHIKVKKPHFKRGLERNCITISKNVLEFDVKKVSGIIFCNWQCPLKSDPWQSYPPPPPADRYLE